MIQADKSGKKELDMNCCYKLIVSGISGGKCFGEILQNVWDYTGVPVRFSKKNQEVLYEVGKEQVTADAQCIVHECLDDVRIEAVILDDQRKIQVQELADILAKSIVMYQKNRKIQGTIKISVGLFVDIGDRYFSGSKTCRKA